MPGIIGLNDTADPKSNPLSPSSRPRIVYNPTYSSDRSYTAVANDVVTKIHVNLNGGTTTTAVAQIGLYDVSNYPASIDLIASDTIDLVGVAGPGWQEKVVDWPLVAGTKYAVGLCCNSGSTALFCTANAYASKSGTIDNTTTGATGLPDTFTASDENFEHTCYASVEASSPAGPTFDDSFSPLTNKVDGAIASTDANGWYSNVTGTLVFTEVTDGDGSLPPGLVMTTGGIITGTPTDYDAGFACTITAVDDDAVPVDGNFTWVINPYEIIFSPTDTHLLVDQNNAPRNLSGSVQASVFPGAPDTISGAGEHFANQTIAAGYMTLTPIDGGAGTYTVVLTDTSLGIVVPLGSFEKTSA